MTTRPSFISDMIPSKFWYFSDGLNGSVGVAAYTVAAAMINIIAAKTIFRDFIALPFPENDSIAAGAAGGESILWFYLNFPVSFRLPARRKYGAAFLRPLVSRCRRC